MSAEKPNFEFRYSQKGKDLLDSIFGEFTPDRSRVRLVCPRREHELVVEVDYEQPDQFKRVLGSICKWLEEGDKFDSLESLMLY
ncbi:MAG: hypothetical protein WCX65_06975 [bacterium]